jgi:hypothetical protein
MEGSGVLSDVLLVVLAALGFTALVVRRLAARLGHRKARTVAQHDPLADLFKGDTLAKIIAELAAHRYQLTPHAMLAALRKVWREEEPGLPSGGQCRTRPIHRAPTAEPCQQTQVSLTDPLRFRA